MRFSPFMRSTCRLIVGSIVATLLVIGMALPAWAMSTTSTRGTIPQVPTRVAFQLNPAPRDPGCEGANAQSIICQNTRGGTGNEV